MAEACPAPLETCKYAGTPDCVLTKHHLYWPAPEYTTEIERFFRERLPQNIEYDVPRCEHDEKHATTNPPEKPSQQFMVGFILASEVHIPKRIKRKLKEIANA